RLIAASRRSRTRVDVDAGPYFGFDLTAVAESKRPAVVDRRPEKPLACTQSDGTRLTRFVEQTTRTFPPLRDRSSRGLACAGSLPRQQSGERRRALYCGADRPMAILGTMGWRAAAAIVLLAAAALRLSSAPAVAERSP